MYKFRIFAIATITAIVLSSFTVAPVFYPYDPMISKPGAVKASWKKELHDFGEIPQGKPVTVDFSFTNEGDAPLVIKEVVSTCGCTVPDFPKEAIAPGKSSKITVTFNAAHKGVFLKTITVKSNDKDAAKELKIKGTVV